MKRSPARIPWKTLTVRLLRQMARTIGIPGRSAMNKSQLISALKKETAAQKRVKSMICDFLQNHKAPAAEPTSSRAQKPATETSKPADTAKAMPAPVSPGHAMPYIDRGKPIPDTYGHDTLRLMVRDPEWIFVYWELTPERLSELHERYADVYTRTWQIKLIENESGQVDYIPVFIGAYNWYLKVKPKHTYQVELGFEHENTFISVAQSNSCRTPGNAISERGDEEWMILRRDLMHIMKLTSEEDLLYIDHPHTSGERYLEITEEQLTLLRSQAKQAGLQGASAAVPSVNRDTQKS